ncbi:MAG: DUF1653 domain-containing protein [Candidatus Pacebacteria bacterium]|jgi:hypothetical protein|nr:DUF1653 domain-containing protein [Candidatus Paceibacterota bacterium]
MEREIIPGKYRHFKGFICDVVGVAKHSEDHTTELVVYWHANAEGMPELWARPKAMFLETVLVDGKEVERFTYIG